MDACRLGVAAVLIAIWGALPLAHANGVSLGSSNTPTLLAAPAVVIDASDAAAIAKRWGIRIESLRLAAAGYMLDFRYQVVDARKAAPLFRRQSKPVLTDERTGAVMLVPAPPKTGALRNSYEPKAGRSYFLFFANPGRLIAEGQTVTVTIGPFSVSGLRVGV